MPEIKLKTLNKLISGFDGYILHESVYALSNVAVLKLEKDAEEMPQIKKLLQKGQPAEVLIDKTTKVKGYISKVKPFYRKDTEGLHPILEIKVSSPAAAYVNCSIMRGRTFQSQYISDILHDLFPDIEIEAQSDRILPIFVVYGYEDYDTAVARLCAKSDLLIYSGTNGQIIIAERNIKAQPAGELRTGDNILSIEPLEEDEYAVTICGQQPLSDEMNLNDAVCSRLSQTGSKNRLLCVDEVSPAALAAMQSKNKRTNVSCPNWYDNAGNLLQINTRLKVVDNWIGVNDVMFVHTLDSIYDKAGFSSLVGVEKND